MYNFFFWQVRVVLGRGRTQKFKATDEVYNMSGEEGSLI